MGSSFKYITRGTPKADAVQERTPGAGVTVDDVLIKDGVVNADSVKEKTLNAGVTVDDVLIKDGVVTADSIQEKTTDAGVLIDDVLVKDGVVVFPKRASAPSVDATKGQLFVDTNGELIFEDDNGNVVPITGGGVVVTNWTVSGSDIFNNNSGNVGVGPGVGAGTVDEQLHIAKVIDGGDVAVLIENSFTNTAASVDETVSLKFGFGGINDAAAIQVGKIGDFVAAGDRDSFLTLSVDSGGTPIETVKIVGGLSLGAFGVGAGVAIAPELVVDGTANEPFPRAPLDVRLRGSTGTLIRGSAGPDTVAIFEQSSGTNTRNSDIMVIADTCGISAIFLGKNTDGSISGIQATHSTNIVSIRVNNLSPFIFEQRTGLPPRVGIGSSPDFTLEVRPGGGPDSEIGIITTTAVTASLFFGDLASNRQAGIRYFNATNLLSFRTGSVDDRMVIDSAGLIGVGTASPDELLHTAKIVDGGDVAVLIENSFTNTAASTDETASLKFGFGGINTAGTIRVGKISDFDGAGDQDSFMAFRVMNNDSDDEVMRLVGGASVRVGIGTTLPDEIVHIAEAIDGDFIGLLIENSQTNDTGVNETAQIRFAFGGQNDAARIVVGKTVNYLTAVNRDSFMAFSVEDGGVTAEGLRIVSANSPGGGIASVGINQTLPLKRLHVRETTATNNAILSVAVFEGELTTGNWATGFGPFIDFRIKDAAVNIVAGRIGVISDRILALQAGNGIGGFTTMLQLEGSQKTVILGGEPAIGNNTQFTQPLTIWNQNSVDATIATSLTVAAKFTPGSPAAGFGPQIAFREDSSGVMAVIQAETVVSGTRGILIFRMGDGVGGLVEIMRLRSTGAPGNRRVGIDSSAAPSRLLTVGNSTDRDGEVAIIAATGGVSSLFFGDTDDDVGKILYDHTTDSMRFHTNVLEAMRIDSSGNVGIGTPSPQAKLEVGGTPGTSVGGFASGNLHVTGQSASVNANAVITGHNLFGGNKQLWYLGSVSSSNDNIAFINRQNGSLGLHTNNLTRLFVAAGGDVGIGTTGPDELLHIAKAFSGDVVGALLENSQANDAGIDETIALNFGFGGINTAAQIKVGKIGDFVLAADRDAFISFQVSNNGALAEILRIEGGDVAKMSFFGAAATAQDTGWTIFANLASDKTLDANATTVEELADVLGTLIEELKTKALIAA